MQCAGIGFRRRGALRGRCFLFPDAEGAQHFAAVSVDDEETARGQGKAFFERVQRFAGAERFDACRVFYGTLDFLVNAHAAVLPERPVDGQALARPLPGPPQLFAELGVGIHEPVAVGIIALAGVARDRRDRREEDEKVQGLAARGFVHGDGSVYLGREHRIELFPRFVDDEGIADDAGAVNDPVKRAETGLAQGDQSLGVFAQGYVGPDVQHFGAERFQLSHLLCLFLAELGPAGEDELRFVVPGKVLGDVKADSAGSAGEQVYSVLPDPRSSSVVAGRQLTHPLFPPRPLCVVADLDACVGLLGKLQEDAFCRPRAVRSSRQAEGLVQELGMLQADGPGETAYCRVPRLGLAVAAEIGVDQPDPLPGLFPHECLAEVQDGIDALLQPAGRLGCVASRPQVQDSRGEGALGLEVRDQALVIGWVPRVDRIGACPVRFVPGAGLYQDDCGMLPARGREPRSKGVTDFRT